MTYQISYFSPQGHARELALSIRKLFPSNTPTVNLVLSTEHAADVHLVGFEFLTADLTAIPSQVVLFLQTLAGRDILLFATCPICANPQLREQVEQRILPLLPPRCRFHGLFLCQGEVYVTVLETLSQQAAQEKNPELRQTLSQYRKGRGHPNREDIRSARRFISAALHLNSYL